MKRRSNSSVDSGMVRMWCFATITTLKCLNSQLHNTSLIGIAAHWSTYWVFHKSQTRIPMPQNWFCFILKTYAWTFKSNPTHIPSVLISSQSLMSFRLLGPENLNSLLGLNVAMWVVCPNNIFEFERATPRFCNKSWVQITVWCTCIQHILSSTISSIHVVSSVDIHQHIKHDQSRWPSKWSCHQQEYHEN